ncbi:phosphatase PAP2 family protein [Rossellomorea aquimaris]|uniref:phosphatase PAP2 family protein n=1 Tax=Rossellomorea aquimaris TaxID=189382 RepID=UPI001CD655B9|nr:phosphatase PAP2 family protein [Rossellomorea aquimaris]MCA1056464.1 phosphatase PAP2 family protein [Rossellomorea aquimaris]
MKKTIYIPGIITFILFMTVAHFVYHELSMPWDPYLLDRLASWHLLKIFSVVGTELVIGGGSILLILYLWWGKKDFPGILTVVVAVGGSNVLNKVIKNLMERDRPPFPHGEEGFSFPSGHAMVGIVFLLTASYFISREFSSVKVKRGIFVVAFIIALLTGISRVVEQVHYPSDVLAGFLIGFSIFALTTFLYEKRPT